MVAGAILSLAVMPRGDAAITLTTLYQTDPTGYVTFSAGLIQGTDGNFYGTTSNTVFRLTPEGEVTTLHTFGDADGSPAGALLQASDGNFYGATSFYSQYTRSGGMIFKITPDGVFTTLHAFTIDPDLGMGPNGPLVEGPDGDLYGTTQQGDTIFVDGVESTGYGTVFKISPADGTLTTLYRFNGDQGQTPITGLLLASDGNFYGVAEYNRFTTAPVIYRIAPDGTFSVLHRYNSTDGFNGYSLPFEASDGNLYGANGSVFRLTLDGTLTIVHAFDSTNGEGAGSLIQGRDGNFYGTTPTGGAYGFGTIFKLAPDGSLATLRSFDGVDGAAPFGLIQTADGSFYGATNPGFNPQYRTDASPSEIFHLTVDDAPALPVVTITTVPEPNLDAQDESDLGVRLTLSSPPDTNVKVRCRVKGYTLSGEAVTVDVKLKIKAGQTSRFFSTDFFLPDFLDYAVPLFATETIKVKVLPGNGYVLNEDRRTKLVRDRPTR